MTQRTDIQALRGLAVLLVVFYHAKLLPLPGGYLGVDIFFVISGYLITSLIARSVRAGTFSFAGFYYRRARRLLPAAYVTLIICIALSPFLLTSIEMRDFAMQVLGTVTFTGNLVLWGQTGYFEGAAELKPLLHVWSLAIEEQYYLLLPAALVFVPRRYWLSLMVMATVLSLGLFILLGPTMPGATFYLYPTRAWELGVGSVMAIATLEKEKFGIALSYVGLPAGVALLLIPAFPVSGKSHPEIDAVLVCLATALIIIGNYRLLNTHVAAKALARVGDMSYSLYLVHWPIFSFFNNAKVSGGGLWWPVRVGGVCLAFVLALVLYRQIEQRFRLTGAKPVSAVSAAGMAVLPLLIVAVSFGINWGNRSAADFAHRLRSNVGFSALCESTGDFVALPACRNSDKPTMVVWGDSFAMHLVPGIAATSQAKVMQVTRSTCAPLLGFAILSPPNYGREWAQDCIRFNQAALRTIANMPSIEVVVLASESSYFLFGRVLTLNGERFEERAASVELAANYLRETVRAIRKAGKRVIIMAPPPRGDFNIGKCIERSYTKKISFGASSECLISTEMANNNSLASRELLNNVGEREFVNIFSFRDTLCTHTLCATQWDGNILYRDSAHLSYEGSIAIAKKAELVSQLEDLAK